MSLANLLSLPFILRFIEFQFIIVPLSFAKFSILGTHLALKFMVKKGVAKQTIKPTFGEFEFETDKQDFVRLYFFLTIKNECPYVLEDLQDEPLKLYRREFGTYSRIDNFLFQENHFLYAEAKCFDDSLQTWREKWKLKSPVKKHTFEEYFERTEQVWKVRNEYNDKTFFEMVCPAFRLEANGWSKEKVKEFREKLTKEIYLLRYGNINTNEEAKRHLEAMRQSYEQLSDERHQRYEDEKTEWINDFAGEILYWWKRNEKWKSEMIFDFTRCYIWETISPETEGLEVWRYRDDKKEFYIESQRQTALKELNNTNLASLSADVKNYVAESRAKQAEDYYRKVKAQLRTQSPKLKNTDQHPEFDRNMRYTVRMLCQNPQPTWEDLAKDSLKQKGHSYTKNKITLEKEIRALRKSVKAMLEILGFSQSIIFGKQGRPKKSK